MRWQVAELGMLWGHRGLSRANGRETRLDPFFPLFNFPSPFVIIIIVFIIVFFSFLSFFFVFSQHFFDSFVHFCSHVLFSPPYATHEKSKIGIINFERRIPCYRMIIIIIIITPGIFLTLLLL